MNANELANELENITTYKEAEHDIFSDKEKLTEAADMLRQQQAEITNLMELVDIQKAVSRDVDIDFLNLTISQQQAEIKDLKQQVAFLEDWRDTWSPTIKQLMNINVKAQEK